MVSEETWHRMVRRANAGRVVGWSELLGHICAAAIVSCSNEAGVACKIRDDWGKFDWNKLKQGDR